MTIRQLECFLVMAEELHYTKAANRLHVSQPSLSYSISELEKELSLPLFVRKDNRTFLTRYGESLLPYAAEVMKLVNEMQLKAHGLANTSSGTIRLGNIYSVSFDFVPRLLEAFYSDKENGQIAVHISQGVNDALIGQLMEGELDFIISAFPNDERLISKHLFTQELKFIVPESHRLADRSAVSLEDVRDERLISLGRDSNIRNHIEDCFRERGMEASFALEVTECSAMGAYISSGMGTAIAPVVPSFKSNNVKIISFTEKDKELLGRKICLSWVKERYLPSTAKQFRKTFIGMQDNDKIFL